MDLFLKKPKINYFCTTDIIKMKQKTVILMLVMLCIGRLHGRAQFFEFGFPDIDSREQIMSRETIKDAEYKGGKKALNKFIEEKFKHVPNKADVSGMIQLVCVVNEKGRIRDVSIVRSLGHELDNEAMRVVKKLKFKPARQGKKKIKSQISIDVPIRHGKASFSTLQTIDI